MEHLVRKNDTSPAPLMLAGETFTRDLFYSVLDKKRSHLQWFYDEQALLVWNGVKHQGRDAICRFYSVLPTSVHDVTSLTVQGIRRTFLDDASEALVMLTCVFYDVRKIVMWSLSVECDVRPDGLAMYGTFDD